MGYYVVPGTCTCTACSHDTQYTRRLGVDYRLQGHAENLLKHVLRQKFGRLSVGDFLYVIVVMYTARAEQGLASLR